MIIVKRTLRVISVVAAQPMLCAGRKSGEPYIVEFVNISLDVGSYVARSTKSGSEDLSLWDE